MAGEDIEKEPGSKDTGIVFALGDPDLVVPFVQASLASRATLAEERRFIETGGGIVGGLLMVSNEVAAEWTGQPVE